MQVLSLVTVLTANKIKQTPNHKLYLLSTAIMFEAFVDAFEAGCHDRSFRSAAEGLAMT